MKSVRLAKKAARSVLTAALVIVTGCSDDDPCRDFPKSLDEPVLYFPELWELAETDRNTPAVQRALETIDGCYHNVPSSYAPQDIGIWDVRTKADAGFFVIFAFNYVNDVGVVFEVDDNGQVNRMFEISLL